jgi:hypothetical protein
MIRLATLMFSAIALGGGIGLLLSPQSAQAQEAGSDQRNFIQIKAQDETPSVRAIAPIDDTNAFFLNKRGQIGVAKFSPGLSLIAWEYYSEVKLSALPALAIGPDYSVLTASPDEVTQSFDTDQDVELDFFQALVRDWPGRSEGVTITAGPVADPYGRLLFALSPHQEKAEGEEAPPAPRARIVAWHPDSETLVSVTESQLQINDFAIGRGGLLAARLSMPDYEDGYYVSLTQLPPFDPATPSAIPDPQPFALPSLLIPAELTRKDPPTKLCFYRSGSREKLLALCVNAKQLIEIVPENVNGTWQGAILVNRVLKEPIETIVEMSPGSLLAGNDEGFLPLDESVDDFRITSVDIAADGILLDFTEPVDRAAASKPDSYAVRAVSLNGGGESPVTVQPVIESDGRSLILKTSRIEAGTVLQVICRNVPSETGEKLLSSAVYYTIHQR